MSSNTNGIIFDIKRFAIHDGDGIRTTLFVKGCPLRCPWCHNPEGRCIDIGLMWFATLCVGCGECERVCKYDAIIHRNGKTIIDTAKCTVCGDCVYQCPTGALKLDGRRVSAQEAFDELIRDKVFYQSSGGITLSGGEPLFQADFSLAVLKLCKQSNYNTVIETCLYADKDVVLRFVPLVDSFIVDIKILDNEKHKQIIGKSNKRILSNFEALVDAKAKIRVRIPLIPGLTDDDENIKSIAGYVSKVSREIQIELLNYNPLAENKFLTISEKYTIGSNAVPLSKSEMNKKKRLVLDILEGNNES